MEIYIYTLSHPITNEVRYVGKTINVKRRYKQHLYDKRTSHKASWVKSLKKDGLKPIMTIIEVCTDNWQEREIFWISQYNNLTNLKQGGGTDYVRTTSEETKEKLRQANLGKVLSDNHKEKIGVSVSKKLKGKQKNDDHKEKLRQAKLGNKLSDDHKKNISKANKGRVFTDEHKEKIKNTKLTNGNSCKKVSIKNKIYQSITEAAKFLGVSKQAIFKQVNNPKKLDYFYV